MGKSVSKGLKYKGEVLLKEMPETFGKNFEKNKEELKKIDLGLSKTNRNVLSGYMIRLSSKKE